MTATYDRMLHFNNKNPLKIEKKWMIIDTMHFHIKKERKLIH